MRKLFIALIVVSALLCATPAYATSKASLIKQNKKLAQQVKSLKRQLATSNARKDELQSAVDDIGADFGCVYTDRWHFGEWNEGHWMTWIHYDEFLLKKGLYGEWLQFQAAGEYSSVYVPDEYVQ